MTAAGRSPGSWRLGGDHAQRSQGLVVSGFAHLPTGRALFLRQQAKGCGWLARLDEIAPITSSEGKQPRAAAIAFTCSGLEALGVPARALASFSQPFRDGMLEANRRRRLKDWVSGKWADTVIAGGPAWAGQTPEDVALVGQAPRIVHAVLLLYAESEERADEWTAEVSGGLAAAGVALVQQLPLELKVESGISREHFGFADGISQPVPYDATLGRADADKVVRTRDGAAMPTDPWNGVALGDLLFGHVNGHNEVATGPVLSPDADLATDGSYVVIRQLKQDVAAFWSGMEKNAKTICEQSPEHAEGVTARWLAERVIGRTVDGQLLCPKGTLLNDDDNNFGFFERDRFGTGCPVGSHVRRGNPRDGLAPTDAARPTLLQAANRHRILRRARKYGKTSAEQMTVDDKVDRGLLFIAINTDIERQFEFVQQTWIMNPNFATLYDETDPLLGPASMMTIRDQPVRRRVAVDTFIRLVGGDYFFLPSLPALDYLARLA